MIAPKVKELLLQSLEHERGGVLVYKSALECVVNDDLRKEFEEYLEQTENHVTVLTRVCADLELDPSEMTPGCQIVHENGKALVKAIKMAQAMEDAGAAEIVACECVVLAETKDHANWELIGACGDELEDDTGEVLREAYEEVEDEEDEHLYHSKGWCRELWLQALDLEAVLPPPEEREDVKTATEAAQAKQQAHPTN
jgi:rubrerythrin